MKKSFSTLLSMLFATGVSFAQEAPVQNGTPYTQNFDGIGTETEATLPVAWKMDRNSSTASGDFRKVNSYHSVPDGNTTITLLTTTEQIGGNNLGNITGLINFGAGDGATATDRAVGFRGANGVLRSAGNLYLKLKNTGETPITALRIDYDIEKYKKSGSALAGVIFEIQLWYSADGETWLTAGDDFKSPFSDVGTDADGSGYPLAPGVTVSVSGILKDINGDPVPLAAGDDLYLAWNYSRISTSGTNGSPALAIDNVAIGDVATMPLKFTSFNAKLNGLTNKQALLTWTTEQELNTGYFEIERAGSNSSFEKVGTLASANTSGQHSYSFTDTQPLSDVSYYRIKQVDKDGKYTYSEIKSVKNDVSVLAVYPNPAAHSINVVVPQNLEQCKLVIYNAAGEKVYTKNNVASADKIDVSGFSAGFYLIEISGQNQKETAKFLKQ